MKIMRKHTVVLVELQRTVIKHSRFSLVRSWLQLPQFLLLKKFIFSGILFFILISLFFKISGQSPLPLLKEVVNAAFGSPYSWSETLVKTTPVLLCAIATALPARLGLISVGAEGQMYIGALVGTAPVIAFLQQPMWVVLPLMLLASGLGGALWSGFPGWLKARMGINETISTLLLNYVAILLVNFAVYGPWKDPASLGWPATVSFPDAAKLPTFFNTRIHLGLVIGIGIALLLHVLLTYSRWGLELRVMRSNQKVSTVAGLKYGRTVIWVMAIAGGVAGLAGILEASMIQGRLQSDLSVSYGLSGFLVAWLAGQNFVSILLISLLVGGLSASADALQLFAQFPSSSALIMQGLLFTSALTVNGLINKQASGKADYSSLE
ncbi:ABC transporter permease [Leptolyngbya sp. FACHB-711]|nr:ABC transporter permease [Leptolyngbya sp. FACHB-711]